VSKTHPDTLRIREGMACLYCKLEDFKKAEEHIEIGLEGYERALGKDHDDTKHCAENLAALLVRLRSKTGTLQIVDRYPHLLAVTQWHRTWFTPNSAGNPFHIVESIKELLKID
jgi:hypothetical protein